MTMPENQLDQLRELETLYSAPFNDYRNEVSEEVKHEIRKAWLAFRDSANFAAPSEADLAAVGAILPLLMAMETQSPEKVKQLAYYMMFSLMDENL